ncbi:MAG TPA: basic secretory protein-like protein [Caulobacteraceae bacterium]|jgi:hypothetical protein|nr:basic secretory protein-like protein [Caulobacteraceae bacterium]
MMVSRRALLGGLAAGAAFLAAGPLAAAADALDVEVDTSQAPDLAAWGVEVQARAPHWWRTINRVLAAPGFTPPAKIFIRPSPASALPPRAAAQARGEVIFVNAPYLRAHPQYNFIAHEMVHIVQPYGTHSPGWVVEGIADWVRYYILFPDDQERLWDPSRGDWRRGYQQAAALLDYEERVHGAGTVRALNAALHRGEDPVAWLQRLDRTSLPLVWDQVLQALRDGSPPPA